MRKVSGACGFAIDMYDAHVCSVLYQLCRAKRHHFHIFVQPQAAGATLRLRKHSLEHVDKHTAAMIRQCLHVVRLARLHALLHGRRMRPHALRHRGHGGRVDGRGDGTRVAVARSRQCDDTARIQNGCPSHVAMSCVKKQGSKTHSRKILWCTKCRNADVSKQSRSRRRPSHLQHAC
jgi:hypothetical protein